MKIVNLKNDLSDAQDALEEDQTFYAELKKGCANAESESPGVSFAWKKISRAVILIRGLSSVLQLL